MLENAMKDANLAVIKSIVSDADPELTAYLFGSRSKKTHQPESDYDIMIETAGNPDMKTKIDLSSRITKLLADQGITADVIVESKTDIQFKKKLTGSIVKNALNSAIKL